MQFVNKQAPLYGFDFRCSKDILKIDDYLEKIEKFYIVSLKRDVAFLKNLRKSNDKRQPTILITGGFHSDNLTQAFKKNNISYISIAPNFTNEDGYECPYFKLLSGQKKIVLAKEMEKLTGQALAYCSPNTPLAGEVDKVLHDVGAMLPSPGAATPLAKRPEVGEDGSVTLNASFLPIIPIFKAIYHAFAKWRNTKSALTMPGTWQELSGKIGGLGLVLAIYMQGLQKRKSILPLHRRHRI